jgi:hypothetical protein
MNELVWILVAAGAWFGFLIFAISRIRYAVDDKFVRVVLFGMTVRKVALSDIEDVFAGRPWWHEHWDNTIWVVSRSVTIRRKSGWIRNFCITPENREEFIATVKKKLESARRAQLDSADVSRS